MRGLIDNKQALCHLGLIWREFGPRCTARCIVAMVRGDRRTFLDVVFAGPRGARRSSRR